MLVLVGRGPAADAGVVVRPLPAPRDAAYTVVTLPGGAGLGGRRGPLWLEVTDADRGPFSTMADAVGVDGLSVFMIVVIAAAVVLAALLTDGYLRREGLEGVEPYVLLLSASGGVVMARPTT